MDQEVKYTAHPTATSEQQGVPPSPLEMFHRISMGFIGKGYQLDRDHFEAIALGCGLDPENTVNQLFEDIKPGHPYAQTLAKLGLRVGVREGQYYYNERLDKHGLERYDPDTVDLRIEQTIFLAREKGYLPTPTAEAVFSSKPTQLLDTNTAGTEIDEPLTTDAKILQRQADIDKLSPQNRLIFDLYSQQELSINDIAKTVNLSRPTVRGRLNDFREQGFIEKPLPVNELLGYLQEHMPSNKIEQRKVARLFGLPMGEIYTAIRTVLGENNRQLGKTNTADTIPSPAPHPASVPSLDIPQPTDLLDTSSASPINDTLQNAEREALIANLTPRQRQILGLVGTITTKAIADTLGFLSTSPINIDLAHLRELGLIENRRGRRPSQATSVLTLTSQGVLAPAPFSEPTTPPTDLPTPSPDETYPVGRTYDVSSTSPRNASEESDGVVVSSRLADDASGTDLQNLKRKLRDESSLPAESPEAKDGSATLVIAGDGNAQERSTTSGRKERRRNDDEDERPRELGVGRPGGIPKPRHLTPAEEDARTHGIKAPPISAYAISAAQRRLAVYDAQQAAGSPTNGNGHVLQRNGLGYPSVTHRGEDDMSEEEFERLILSNEFQQPYSPPDRHHNNH